MRLRNGSHHLCMYFRHPPTGEMSLPVVVRFISASEIKELSNFRGQVLMETPLRWLIQHQVRFLHIKPQRLSSFPGLLAG